MTKIFTPCEGDSGGPLWVWQEEEETVQWGRYVILGIVSGGWGKLGKCGGVNNPVHYVR